MIHIPGIDTKQGLYRIGNKMEAYRKILMRFADTNKTAVAQIEELLTEGRLEDLYRLLHTAAGVTGNIGAEETYQRMHTLSAEFRKAMEAEGFIPGAEWNARIREAAGELARLSETIRQYIGEQTAQQPSIEDPVLL